MTLEDDVSCGNTNFKWRYDRDHRSSLRATRGARNPNLQVVITHASHVCSQHSFILVPRACRFLVKLSRVALGTRMTSTKNEWNAQNPIWSRAFGPSISRNLITRVPSLAWNLRKAQLWTIDRCRPHSVTFGYCKFKTLDTEDCKEFCLFQRTTCGKDIWEIRVEVCSESCMRTSLNGL